LNSTQAYQYDYGIVIGPNGACKGSACRALHDEHGNNEGFVHVEMSHVLKLRRKHDPEFDRLADVYMSQQEMVPCQKLCEVLFDYLRHIPKHRRLLFDGIPRKYLQCKLLCDFLKKRNPHAKILVLHFQASEETVIRNCQDRYRREHRDDDSSTFKILKRLHTSYKEEIEPILDYLQDEGFEIVEVDANLKRDTVVKNVNNILLGIG
jgi:adenylate kinase family enzyme